MPKRFGLCCALLALSTSALAQSRGPAARLESTLWDHDGSVVYLLALGAAREFHYREPRAGMVEAGARPGALLFRGAVANGQFAGTAFIFDRRCGPLPYAVSGPILDHDERVVLTGEAPLVGAKCRVQGHFTEVLEFRLQNANKTARALAPENAPSPALPTEERAALPAPAPPAPSRESQSPSPTPPAVAAEHAPAPKAAAAPPPPPPQRQMRPRSLPTLPRRRKRLRRRRRGRQHKLRPRSLPMLSSRRKWLRRRRGHQHPRRT